MNQEVEESQRKKSERIIFAKQIQSTKNFVNLDSIRKEVNLLEKKNYNNWPKRYKFLEGDYFQKLLSEECTQIGLPTETFTKEKTKDLAGTSPIPIKSSPPLPVTSSAIVGWRSHNDYNLEFLGKLYVPPKSTIEPPLKSSEFSVKKQNFIFLG